MNRLTPTQEIARRCLKQGITSEDLRRLFRQATNLEDDHWQWLLRTVEYLDSK